jgi:membrane-associated phospholipid phosphatase
LLAPGVARAQEVRELDTKLALDLPLTLGALSLWVGTELAKPHLGPEECRWCRDNALDRGARDALLWENTLAAKKTSNWITVGVLPLSMGSLLMLAAARDDALDKVPEDLLVVSEAVALSGLLTQAVKFAAGRERPFVHALPEDAKAHTAHPADNNLSFYSSHTSMAFSTAVAAGTTASMRGYRGAPYVWAVGVPLALLSGYLRVAADRHYLTDVVVGAALGSAFGALVPWLLHRPTD